MKTKKLIIPFLPLILLFVVAFVSSVYAGTVDKQIGVEKQIGVDKQIGIDKQIGVDIIINFDDPNKYSVYKDYPHLKKSFGEYYNDWKKLV